MIYHVIVQLEGGHIIINVINIRSWRMASILAGVAGGLDILLDTL